MAYILNIETATTVCSASLFFKDELLTFEEINDGYTHAENLHLFIDSVVKTAGITLSELNAVAVSKGPGSYTGLRIGVSAAKGLAFGLGIPLLAIDTLQTMCLGAFEKRGTQSFFCPLLDARRMEVYYGVYDQKFQATSPVAALIMDETNASIFSNYTHACFFGEGMPKCKALLQDKGDFTFIENIYPSAKYMGKLAFEKYKKSQFEDVAYFEPFYLKDFLAGKKKSSNLTE